ncbi:hypothetical protein MNB_SM-5-67 [hydrothermal vent metagenome]|uniref:Uncharacterized protein n=1 Tax=hydrothermal vent metagenome TaxID=652676 RepID=A0A1W1BN47_9ZZZZ
MTIETNHKEIITGTLVIETNSFLIVPLGSETLVSPLNRIAKSGYFTKNFRKNI